MTSRLKSVLSAALVLLAVTAPAEVGAPRLPQAEPPAVRQPGVVSFLALGDSGSGGSGQKRVAASMEKVIAASPVDFALLLGDNFYPKGLKSADDPLFDKVFRGVYPPSRFPFPFYVVLGNHEYFGNAAANLKVGSRDARWRMPARRYAFRVPLSATESIHFLALDTTAIDTPARVTPDVDVRPPLEGVAEELLAARDARWRFAFGHHAFLTSGLHGDSEPMLKQLAPVLAGGHVDLWLCGHDHILESLAPVNGVAQVVSGAGAGWDKATPIVHVRKESLFRLTGGGFVRVEVRSEKATVMFYDVDGVARHVRTLLPRAADKPRPAANP